jgi:predicted chitinase
MRVKEITEDLSRRGFLKGLGAAAIAATTGGAANAMARPPQTRPSPIETTGLSMNTGPEHSVQRTAIQSGIRGVELAQFMAQVRHESADFSRMKEIGGKQYYAKRYDPRFAPKTAKILGNTHPGDGERYHGRGFIQITGRDNYRMAGDAIGIDLVKHPELAARPDVAAKIAVWYWKTRVKPNVSNFNDTQSVTKYINPAMRGLNDRLKHFTDYKSVMNVR